MKARYNYFVEIGNGKHRGVSAKEFKAKKIEAYYDKYFTTIVYEYRGCRYEVTYANGWNVCCTPAWVQHRDEQERIDRMLDQPVIKAEPRETAQEGLDRFFRYLDGDESAFDDV